MVTPAIYDRGPSGPGLRRRLQYLKADGAGGRKRRRARANCGPSDRLSPTQAAYTLDTHAECCKSGQSDGALC